jgi:hypothetical protein
MRPVPYLSVGLALGAILTAVSVPAQQPPVEVRKLDVQFVDSPVYQLSNTTALGATASQRWLQLQTTFDTHPEWVDELTFRYYVLVGEGENRKILVGDVGHVDIPRKAGQTTYAYIHPNTLQRYTGGKTPERVTVQVLYKERPLLQFNWRGEGGSERWWEAMVNTRGLLMSPRDTPFLMVVLDRMPQLKDESRR